MYDTIAKAWDIVKKNRRSEFKERVPSLISLNSISISKESEGEGIVVVMFTSLNEAVSDTEDLVKLKKTIFNWLKSFSLARIKRSTNENLIVELSNLDKLQMDEAVIKVFTRKGNNIVPSMKCVGGPKHGQRTKDVNTCMQPPSIKRRMARKISARKNKGSIGKKRMKTKLTNIIGRAKLNRANTRLKKARGGLF